MPSRGQLAKMLRKFRKLMELDGANTFKVGAYEKAHYVMTDDSIDLESHINAGTLTDIPGIGKGIAEKINEFWKTDGIVELTELEKKYPAGLLEMTEIPGFGAKKAVVVWKELGVDTIEKLEAACNDGTAAGLKGFGDKTAQKILQGIEQRRKHSGRFLADVARNAATPILLKLRSMKEVKEAEAAGSLRRWLETVKDIDFVVATTDPTSVMKAFVTMPGVERVTGQGETKASVVLESGMAADLRCVAPAEFPFALQHFSGSKEHNTQLRARAKEMGLKSNEYGLFHDGSEKSMTAKTEADVYRKLGLAYIEPEMREGLGEIEAAAAGTLPKLVEMKDLRGLMHMHTHYSDGTPQVEEYAAWAHAHGISWMGIADHSQYAAYAGGLKPDKVRLQWAEIDAVNEKWKSKGVRLLKGIESDILPDGSLDYDEQFREGFEFIVASVHSQFNLSEKDQTARVIRAIENPHTTILGHMTGRLLLRREGFAIDQKEVIRACARCGVVIEINAEPNRLDMDWRMIRFAIEEGCLLSIGPDAHDMGGLDVVKYGLGIARKGWATKEKIVNCLSVEEFLALGRKRRGNQKQNDFTGGNRGNGGEAETVKEPQKGTKGSKGTRGVKGARK